MNDTHVDITFLDLQLTQVLNANVWKGIWNHASVIIKLFAPHRNDGHEEVKILRHLANSPYRFPKVLDYRILDPPQSFYDTFYGYQRDVATVLVLEFIEATPLYSANRPIGYHGLKDVRRVISQLLDQVEFIHSKRIVHHDLADRNILITPEQDLIIIDFGFSFSLDPPYTHGRCRSEATPLQLDGYHLLTVIQSLIKAGETIDETLEKRLGDMSWKPKTISEIRCRLGLPIN